MNRSLGEFGDLPGISLNGSGPPGRRRGGADPNQLGHLAPNAICSTVGRICRRSEERWARRSPGGQSPYGPGRLACILPCNVHSTFNCLPGASRRGLATSPTGRARIWPAKRLEDGIVPAIGSDRTVQAHPQSGGPRAGSHGADLVDVLIPHYFKERAYKILLVPRQRLQRSAWWGLLGGLAPTRNRTSKSWTDESHLALIAGLDPAQCGSDYTRHGTVKHPGLPDR